MMWYHVMLCHFIARGYLENMNFLSVYYIMIISINAIFYWITLYSEYTVTRHYNRVPGQTVNTNIWYDVYKIFLVFWIMFGLGYLFMILSFISRAMRSKTLEHLFLERLKQTHTKIWHQFTKDVVYIRRVLNESYLLKFKVCIWKLRRMRLVVECWKLTNWDF